MELSKRQLSLWRESTSQPESWGDATALAAPSGEKMKAIVYRGLHGTSTDVPRISVSLFVNKAV